MSADNAVVCPRCARGIVFEVGREWVHCHSNETKCDQDRDDGGQCWPGREPGGCGCRSFRFPTSDAPTRRDTTMSGCPLCFAQVQTALASFHVNWHRLTFPVGDDDIDRLNQWAVLSKRDIRAIGVVEGSPGVEDIARVGYETFIAARGRDFTELPTWDELVTANAQTVDVWCAVASAVLALQEGTQR